jgi:hypothetical protein
MENFALFELMKEYGWLAVFALLVIKFLTDRVWPFLESKVFPEHFELRKIRQETELAELRRRTELEDRRIKSIENLAIAFQESATTMSTSILEQGKILSEALTAQNERISHLITVHYNHNDYAVSSLTEIKESLARLSLDEKPTRKRTSRPS